MPITKALRTATSSSAAAIDSPASALQCYNIVAPPEAGGMRVDRFLAAALGSLSRSRLKALIQAGHVRCEGMLLSDPAATVRPGAHYAVTIPAPAPAKPLPQPIPFTIVYEDADLIVVDKPAGLVVHPAPGNPDGTLVNALLAHSGETLPGIGGEKRPGIVHRLDKDTSGLMVVAKTERALAGLTASFAERRLDRRYLALVWGLPAPTAGTIDAPIGRHPVDRKRMAVVARGGKPAVTHYHVERIFYQGAVSLLSCRLLTGRTHQIRVHLAHSGHAVVGDPLYLRRHPAIARSLPAGLRQRLLAFPRQALHAAFLGFRHPLSGDWLAFDSPLPEDIAALLRVLAEEVGPS